jgi:hypothetical protein
MLHRVFLLGLIAFLLVSCIATPGQPNAETSTAPTVTIEINMPTASPTQLPTATVMPTAAETPTLQLVLPAPLFDLYIDNLAISRQTPPGSKLQGKHYASGFNSGDDLRHFAEWDGEKWTELGTGFRTAGNSLAVDSVGNLYTEILTDTAQCMAITQWSGSMWEDITANFVTAVDALKPGRVSCNVPVMALAVDEEDHLYAAGTYYYPSADNTAELPMGYVAEWKNGTWSVFGPGFDGVNLYALEAGAAGMVFASGEQPAKPADKKPIDGFIAQWDGEKWSQMDMGGLEPCTSITRLASDETGGVYLACSVDGPGMLISHWDGAKWNTVTDQLEGEAPTIFDLAVDKNGQLYIAGDFEAVGGVPMRDIAYYDGSSWHALGEGVNERVQALAFDPGGELYAAGWFTEAGGIPVDHIARWDGIAWHALAP